MTAIRVASVTEHVIQLVVPTPTLPPALTTNTYLIVDGIEALVVDAGTTDTDLLAGIEDTIRNLGIVHVQLLATHYHRDHTQGLPWLQARFEAPLYIHPLDTPAASREMGSNGVAIRPVPNQFHIGQTSVIVETRPGHTHGHVHLRVYPDKVVLVGDHLAGTGSVWIGPPDGHLGPYYEALDSIISGDCTIAGPGHGDIITHAPEAARRQKLHRQERSRQILANMDRWRSIDDLVETVYAHQIVPEALPFARKTIQANLQYFLERQEVELYFDERRGCTLYRRNRMR